MALRIFAHLLLVLCVATPAVARTAVLAAGWVATLGVAARPGDATVELGIEYDGTILEVQPARTEAEVESEEVAEAASMRVEMLQHWQAVNKAAGLGRAGHGNECQEHYDCCHGIEKEADCQWFCKPGTEEVHTQKGWTRKGRCKRKWKGFCLEDEACDAFQLCDREELAYAGTCRDDFRCRNSSCGSGTCVDGKCVCSWGFTGDKCDRSTDAFAFLFYGNSTMSLVSARVLIKSLRQNSVRDIEPAFKDRLQGPRDKDKFVPTRDVVAIVPKSLAAGTPKAFLEVLEADGVKIRYTQDIPMPPMMDRDPIIHKRWSGVMNKFAAWQLTEYSRIALLDSDMVFDTGGDEAGRIFVDCTSELCAVRDGDVRFLNAGVMVITPSEQRLAHLVQALHSERHHFAMPEQSFLTRYSAKWENALHLTYLDQKWNSCVGGGMLSNTGWGTSGYNVLHSCSWAAKPPNIKRCAGACDVTKQYHTVLVWQHYHGMVDACFAQSEEQPCRAAGACAWCGHYCSDQRVPCSAELFREANDEQPEAIDNSQAILECQKRKLKKAHEEPWADMPAGWWAWPRTAMYQLMTDRFASLDPKPCLDLDDYCGGNFASMRTRLGYLSELGVDGLLMNPVVTNMAKGYHGYWTKDLDTVNDHFGTEEELKDLVLEAHGAGFKVMVDVNLNHAGRKLEDIPYLKPFGSPEYYHSENFSCYSDEDFHRSMRYVERCQMWGLPDYRHEHPFVWNGLLQWLRKHIDTFGFDGVRVDAARHIPISFLSRIREVGAPIPAFHEVVESDAKMIAPYASDDFSAIYNYPLYYLLKDVYEPGPLQKPMTHLAKAIREDDTDGKVVLNFLDNNDVMRFTTVVKNDTQLYRNALLYILGAEGVPVLLYGDEQDLTGGGAPPFPKRPALWEKGYSTRGATFQLVKRTLWLRRRFDGLHQFRQRKIFADHQWLIFARGPLLFVTTNVGGNQSSFAQRVLWDNVTLECHTVRLCNILAAHSRDDCIDVEPGRPTHVELVNGEPKLYVPARLLQEYRADVEGKRRPQSGEPRLKPSAGPVEAAAPLPLKPMVPVAPAPANATASAHAVPAPGPAVPAPAGPAPAAGKAGVEVLPLPLWRSMPGGPATHLEMVPRFPRAVVPASVGLRENSEWLPFMNVPQHLDLWHPPIGVPAMYLAHASLKNACFYSDPDKIRAVYARRSSKVYALCPREDRECEELKGLSRTSFAETLAKDTSVAPGTPPVLYLTFSQPAGLPHGLRHFGFLIESLPGVVPFLPQLRNGTLQVFADSQGREILTPVLTRLGVPSKSIFAPFEGRAHHHCAPELHLEAHSDSIFVVPDRVRALRAELHLPAAPLPWEAQRRIVAVLSGTEGPWQLENLEELRAGLMRLGRVVEVVDADPANVQAASEALSQVEVLVGIHGAHMTNMLYAPQGTKVVEIIPQVPAGGAGNQHYRALAGALDFMYVPVAGAPAAATRQPVHDGVPVIGGNVTTDVEQVTLQVGRLLRDTYL